MNFVKSFNKSMEWIKRYSIPGSGIAVSSKQGKSPYPEVSGYFIPTLLNWGERDLAISYGKWLKDQQLPSGAWRGPDSELVYVFDSGQILKGLISLYEFDDTYKIHIEKCCDWICSLIDESGRLNAPDIDAWAGQVPPAVLLYALEPVKRAGILLDRPSYISKVDSAVNYFLRDQNVADFNSLSHFHAYIVEALVDLGFTTEAHKAMDEIRRIQKSNGSVPAYNNVKWICSTGLFQYSCIWYKLGKRTEGELAFKYAVKLQNRSGGWYGSYGFFKKYFPKSEISWAVKYFLDSLHLKLSSDFENMADIFSENVDFNDGRFKFILDQIGTEINLKILDIGCGKGRYLKNLSNLVPGNKYFGSDLSKKVLSFVPKNIVTIPCSALKLSFEDQSFDVVYTVEALEHAVNIRGAISEMVRVLKPNGKLIIIDKNLKCKGRIQITDSEQWFDTKALSNIIKSFGLGVDSKEGIPFEKYDGSNRLFTAWVGTKKS